MPVPTPPWPWPWPWPRPRLVPAAAPAGLRVRLVGIHERLRQAVPVVVAAGLGDAGGGEAHKGVRESYTLK